MSLAEVLDRQGRKVGWVAEQLGVSSATVSLWKSGQREIPESRVRQLAELLAAPELLELNTALPQATHNAPLAGPEQADSAASSISEGQDAEAGTPSETALNGSQAPSRRSA